MTTGWARGLGGRRRAARAAIRGLPTTRPPGELDASRPGTPVPLSPLQREFVELAPGRPRRAPTMARVLETRRWIEPESLEQAARLVAARHPALRLALGRDAGGRPFAEVAAERAPAVRAVDLDGERAIAEVLAAERRAADCQRGPGLRVTALRLPERSLVALVADHLVLDECSWWVLVRDLETAIVDPAQYETGRSPAEDGAYLRWLGRLAAHPGSPAGQAGAAYWRAWPPRPLPPTPLDGRTGPRTEAEAARAEIALTAAETAALLARLRRDPALDLPAALLAAIHTAWREWTGERTLPVWLVHHGRRGPLADPAVAGMIGCAAHLYPALLDVAAGDVAGAAREVRRRLDLIPNEGVDHGILRHLAPPQVADAAPDVIFNFLGSLSRSLGGPVFGRVLPELGGLHNEPHETRHAAFDIGAGVEDGVLRMRWVHCRTAHGPATAARLAGNARRALLALAAGGAALP